MDSSLTSQEPGNPEAKPIIKIVSRNAEIPDILDGGLCSQKTKR
jgi:hypothetical protein